MEIVFIIMFEVSYSMTEFKDVLDLRQQLNAIVLYLSIFDPVVSKLFKNHNKYISSWCSNITQMGERVTTFDALIFSYVMRVNVIIIGNYDNVLITNNMHSYLQQLRVHNSIPDKPAIHIYFHKSGSLLEKGSNVDHFA